MLAHAPVGISKLFMMKSIIDYSQKPRVRYRQSIAERIICREKTGLEYFFGNSFFAAGQRNRNRTKKLHCSEEECKSGHPANERLLRLRLGERYST